jgi:hypothetical protein
LDCCKVNALVKGNFLSPVQTNVTACNDGLLEPACRLAYHGLNAYTTNACTGVTNNMTVAILNSNAHSHVHKRGNYADYSPCQTFFDFRYALGIHNAEMDDLKRFESRDDYHNYVSKNGLDFLIRKYILISQLQFIFLVIQIYEESMVKSFGCELTFVVNPQMLDTVKTQTVVNDLFNCIDTKCCPTAGTITTATKCHVAFGHTGETITNIAAIG